MKYLAMLGIFACSLGFAQEAPSFENKSYVNPENIKFENNQIIICMEERDFPANAIYSDE